MKKPTDLKPIQEQVTRPQQKAGAALRSTPRLRPRSTDWDAFEARLAKTLSELEEDQHMELCLKHSNRYVQFMAQGSYGLRMETTSNAYLDKKEQYNRTERARMLNLGWSAPTGAPARATPENDPDGSPNFFIQWEVPLDCVKVAALAV